MTQLTTKDIELLSRGLTALEQIVERTAPMLKSFAQMTEHLPPHMKVMLGGDLAKLKHDLDEVDGKLPEQVIRLKAKLLDIRDEVLVGQATKAAEVKHE